MPGVDALLINFNGGERVLRAVAALLAQSHRLETLLVVDNASDDGTPERLAALDPRVEVWRLERNLGVARARNLGLARLASPLVLVLDHDIYLAPDALALLHAALTQSGATVVCPRIRLLPERDVVQADGAEIHFLCALRMRHAFTALDLLPTEPGEVGGAIGACQLMDRRAVLEAGAFEELMFFYQEDLEFSLRLRARGLRFWCEPRAEVLHERAEGTPGLSFRGVGEYPRRRAYLTMRHRLFALLVHYRLSSLVLLAPVLASAEFVSAAIALRKGWLGEWARAWLWILRQSITILRGRRRAARARRVGDRALFVGGAFPVAQAYLSGSTEERLYTLVFRCFGVYWRGVRRLIR
jgi:GT2 family glycosyltransferase